MKNIILTLSLLILPLFSFSQARVHFTESQIKTEFGSKNIKTAYTNKGVKYLYRQDETVVTYYYINDEGVCYMSMMVPLKQGALNYFVEDYNSKYVIVSDTEWKFYSKNGVMYITLIDVDGTPAFMYYTKETLENKNEQNNNNRTNQY